MRQKHPIDDGGGEIQKGIRGVCPRNNLMTSSTFKPDNTVVTNARQLAAFGHLCHAGRLEGVRYALACRGLSKETPSHDNDKLKHIGH